MTPTKPSLDRLLLTNDDGVDAEGLAILQEIAADLCDDIWTVAPLTEQSGAGHSLTLTEPLRLRRVGEQQFAVRGTPTDCVIMGMNYLMKDKRPTLVLSGVNRGANLAEDVTYSGTVAGAMEGTNAGVASIALSQVRVRGERKTSFDAARALAPDLIRKLVRAGWPPGVLININFPALAVEDIKGVRITRQGHQDLAMLSVNKHKDPRGFSYYWISNSARGQKTGDEDDDLLAIREGWISVTALKMNLTDHETGEHLKKALQRE